MQWSVRVQWHTLKGTKAHGPAPPISAWGPRVVPDRPERPRAAPALHWVSTEHVQAANGGSNMRWESGRAGAGLHSPAQCWVWTLAVRRCGQRRRCFCWRRCPLARIRRKSPSCFASITPMSMSGERPRHGRARRIRADGTISGPAVGHRDKAQPPAPAALARRAPLFRRSPAHRRTVSQLSIALATRTTSTLPWSSLITRMTC